MPMSVYVGPPRSGKTYEAVASVIVPAIVAGRRVVTNVSGLDEDRIAEFTGVRDPIIIPATEAQLRDIASYPTKERSGSLVEPGDLIVVDEAHNVFPASGAKAMDAEFLMFFRTHGHFTDSQGRATDIVFISQAINDIHVGIRRACEFVFNIRNLRSFGMSKRYKVLSYMGWRMSEKEFLKSEFKRYDERVFALYKSFVGGVDGVLAIVDKRQQVVSKSRVFLTLGLMIFGLGAMGYAVHSFLARTKERQCSGSGLVVDWSGQRYFSRGGWHAVDRITGSPGTRRLFVGDCYFLEGGAPSV